MKNLKILTLIALLCFCLVLPHRGTLRAADFPVTYYDYWSPLNGYSPEVSATGGLNLTRPHSTHTAFYNPALLAFRDRTTISASMRYNGEDESHFDSRGIPGEGSSSWQRENFSYLGIDSENIGFSYVALASLQMDKRTVSDETEYANYLDYYLDAYRFSFAEKTGLLSFGLNLSLINGRVVYLRERLEGDLQLTEQFVDSRGWGYNLDFGAAVKNGNVSYGLTIPNLLSKVFWEDHENYSFQRRLHAGIQYGEGVNYIVSGLSRKFDFSSNNTYHLGMQQMISFGMIRGQYQYLPLRVGVFAEKFNNLKRLGYSLGTGYSFSYFQLDLAYVMHDQQEKRYSALFSLSVGL